MQQTVNVVGSNPPLTSMHYLDKLLDEPTVWPLPGDSFGLWRKETDESLRRRITKAVVNHDPGDEEPLINWL